LSNETTILDKETTCPFVLRKKGAKVQYVDQYHVSAREASQRYRERQKKIFVKADKV